jgi:hypothetical protein
MQITRATLHVLFAFGGLIPALAQQPGEIVEIHINRVKPGMT